MRGVKLQTMNMSMCIIRIQDVDIPLQMKVSGMVYVETSEYY